MSSRRFDTALVWFRRDLRTSDHAALYHALKEARRVFCAFVFDTEILDALPSRADRRVEFIWESLIELKAALEAMGGGLTVRHGRPREEIVALARELALQAVYANHDYEPQAIARDARVARDLAGLGVAFHTYKDHVVFEKDEVMTREGRPFSVYTPYKNAWLAKVSRFYVSSYPVERYVQSLARLPGTSVPALEAMGFERTNLAQIGLPAGMSGARVLFADFLSRIQHYEKRSD